MAVVRRDASGRQYGGRHAVFHASLAHPLSHAQARNFTSKSQTTNAHAHDACTRARTLRWSSREIIPACCRIHERLTRYCISIQLTNTSTVAASVGFVYVFVAHTISNMSRNCDHTHVHTHVFALAHGHLFVCASEMLDLYRRMGCK